MQCCKSTCTSELFVICDAALGYDCGLVGSNKPSSCYNFPPFEIEEEEEEEEDDDEPVWL